MRPETDDPDAEREVDLARWRAALAARWWLPALGLLAGIAVGYVLALGGGTVYKADATIYLGQPFSPGGGAPVQSLATNPSTVSEIVRSESALKAAARASGLRVAQLRGKVSSQVVSSAGVRRLPSQTPLMTISVKGPAPVKTEKAANALALRVVDRTSGYVSKKIETYNRRLTTQSKELTSIEARIDALNEVIRNARDLTPLERLDLISQQDNAEGRRGQIIDQISVAQQLLALAQDVESARIVEPASAVKTSARSKRTSIVVGGLIGLLLGGIAALLWEPARSRSRPTTT
jgi:uncharacterized protein involved in exopolysaccharide biosynthesis